MKWSCSLKVVNLPVQHCLLLYHLVQAYWIRYCSGVSDEHDYDGIPFHVRFVQRASASPDLSLSQSRLWPIVSFDVLHSYMICFPITQFTFSLVEVIFFDFHAVSYLFVRCADILVVSLDGCIGEVSFRVRPIMIDAGEYSCCNGVVR